MWGLIQITLASHVKDLESCLISPGTPDFEFPCGCSENPWAISKLWTGLLGKCLFPFCFSVSTGASLALCPWQVIFFVTFTFVMALTSWGLRQRFVSGHPWDCSTPYSVLSTASPLPSMVLLQEPDSTKTFWLWLPSTVRWPSHLYNHAWDWTWGWYFHKL